MKKLLTICFIALLATACNKERKIDKNLTKDGGVWNIDEMYYNDVYYGSTATDTYKNVGTYQFNEDGTGVATYSNSGNPDVYSFFYSVGEDKLNISMDGYIYNYSMEWKKDKIDLSFTETYSGGNGHYTQTMKFSKKK